MNLKVSEYLKKYIQEKYPRYFEKVNNTDILHFISSIATNSSFKKYDGESVLSGKCDKIIDGLIDKYAQLKLTDVWLDLVSEYLSEYIQGRYPMYYNAIHSNEFESFVKNIASNSIFRERGLNAVLDGETDKFINKLVVEYARLRLTNTWANFGSFCSYIKNVISKKYGDDIDGLNEKTLDDIIKDIALGISVDSENDYSQYMVGSFDNIFLTNFDAHYDDIKKKCYEHIKKVIDMSSVKVKFDKDTYIELLDNLLSDLLKEYSKDDILSGLCDDKILDKFHELVVRKRTELKTYVKSVVEGMTLIFGVPVDMVVSDLTKMVMETGELSASKMLSGKLDELIEGYASRMRVIANAETSKRKLQEDADAAKKHVSEKVKFAIAHANVSQDIESELVRYVLHILYDQHGYSFKDIASGRHDNLISSIAGRRAMEYNSVENPQTRSRVKRGRKKRKLPKPILMLLLVAILTFGAATVKVADLFIDGISEIAMDIQSVGPERAVDEFDGFDYSYIFIKETDAFKPTALNTLSFYNKVQAEGYTDPSYCYLGFYRAYENVRDDRLYIMDSMLSVVKAEARQNSACSQFYASISDDSCFLEFAMNRLEEMGCEEIKDDKYQNVLSAYMRAYYDNIGKPPMDHMSAKDVALVEEIMEMYRKYSQRALIQFGNLKLGQTKPAQVVELAGISSGRGV